MKLLFVRTDDMKPFANQVAENLRRCDIDCITYKQVLRQTRLDTPIARALEEMVQEYNAVLVFASKGLLTNDHALRLVDLAAANGNLVSILPHHVSDRLTLPASFIASSLLLLRAGPDPEIFAREIFTALMKR